VGLVIRLLQVDLADPCFLFHRQCLVDRPFHSRQGVQPDLVAQYRQHLLVLPVPVVLAALVGQYRQGCLADLPDLVVLEGLAVQVVPEANHSQVDLRILAHRDSPAHPMDQADLEALVDTVCKEEASERRTATPEVFQDFPAYQVLLAFLVSQVSRAAH